MLALRPSETVSLRILPHASYSTVHTASPLALCAAIGVRDVQVLSSGGIFSTCVDYSYKLIDNLPQQKAVLLESLQWFTKEGVPPNALLYRLSFEHVYNTLSNPKVSVDRKSVV